MTTSHKALAEALASFSPHLTALSPDTGPVPAAIALDAAIERLVDLMTQGKALYSPTVLQTAGEYQAHQITIREQPISEKAGKKLLELTIYLDSDSPASPMDAAAIAHGMIAIAGNAAHVITAAKQAELAAEKKDIAGPGDNSPAGGPGTGTSTEASSSGS